MSDQLSLDKIYLSRCIEVTGDARLGAFIHRLVRWQSKTRIIKDGRRWVAWPSATWMKDQCLSRDQFRLVLEKVTRDPNLLVLRRQGLRDGLNVLHLALSDNCLHQLINGPRALTQAGAEPLTQVGAKALTLYKNPKKEPGEEPEEKIASAFGVASLAPQKESEEGSPEEEKKEKKEKNSTNVIPFPVDQGGLPVAEANLAIEAKIAADATKAINILHPDSVAALVPIWTGATGEFVTMKMRGMLKNLIKKLAPATAPELVDYAVKHWGDIVYEAEGNHGAFKCPDKPNLGFLLKFAHVAVHCKALADKHAAYVISELADPHSDTSKKAAHLAMLHGEAAKMKAAKLLKAAS